MRGDQFGANRRRASRPFRLVVLSGVPAAYEIARVIHASAVIGKPYQADEMVRTIWILAAPGGSSQDAAGD
jgi:hypothetical protein